MNVTLRRVKKAPGTPGPIRCTWRSPAGAPGRGRRLREACLRLDGALRLLQLFVDVGGGAAELGEAFAERARDLGQPLRSEDDERDDHDHHQLGHADAEHSNLMNGASPSAITRRYV